MPATKAELKSEQDKIVKLQDFFSRYFHGKNHYKDDGKQSYLFFQPVYKYLKNIANRDHISALKSKGLSDDRIKSPAASNNSFTPALNHVNSILGLTFNG